MKEVNNITQYILECTCNAKKSRSYMAKPQLHKIAEYASKMLNMIPEGEPIEDWMESKIAQIADDISEVYHRLDYNFEGGIPQMQQHSPLDEELDPVGDEDGDIDNDGDVDNADIYLKNRRNVISRAINKDSNIEEEEKLEEKELCARGKRAAKKKYDTYPSAYANGYAVQVCKGDKPGLDGKNKKAKGWS